MTFAPRFSPDGNKVIMSLATGGNTDIYTMDLRTRRVEQLTNSPAIDTSPSYSPDGQRIVFESDRGGTQQLYVMDANGGNPTRITFGQGRYASPVWSPRGDLIAYTRINGGPLLDRRDAARRHRRTHFERGIPRGRADLGAEWPRSDVLRRTSQR